jgi:hypothetical protein
MLASDTIGPGGQTAGAFSFTVRIKHGRDAYRRRNNHSNMDRCRHAYRDHWRHFGKPKAPEPATQMIFFKVYHYPIL